MITELQSKIKYQEIIAHIHSLAIPYNQLLKSKFEDFKNKIEKHKTSLEKKIRCYIENISRDLTKHSCCVNKLIKLICENVKSLETNYSKLGEFDKYESHLKLMKPCIRLQNGETGSDMQKLQEIFDTHKEYKECLESCLKIKCELNELKHYLQVYLLYICQSIKFINKCNDIKNSYNIDAILDALEDFKPYVNEFDNYLSCVKRLQEIGKHIRTMKSNLKGIEDKVEEKAKNYIEGIAEIKINASEVEKEIREINIFNNIIIGKLQIAKHTIDFYRSLEEEIKKLNDLEFEKYNVYEFLKNSPEIQKKLTSFDSNIKEAISKIKKSFREIPDHIVVMEGNTYNESYYENIISPVQKLIDTTLLEISVIRYIVYYLKIIDLNSKYLDFIKTKINEITSIDTSITNLNEILRLLRTFYLIHRNSMNMVIIFNFISFARHSINQYLNRLSLVKYYVEILIFAIKCYIIMLSVIKFVTTELKGIREKIEDLKSKSKKMDKIKDYTSNIIKCLESTNSSIKSLKTVNHDLNVKTLKNNISKIKHQIKEVYQNTLKIKVNLNEIIKITVELYNINSEILKVQKSINDMMIKIYNLISYLYTYYLTIILLIGKNYIITNEKRLVFIIEFDLIFKSIKNLQSIIKYLIGMNSVIDKMGIKEFIQNIESQKTSTEKLVNKIETHITNINKGVVDVECAIEGVALNFIKCMIKSLSTNLTMSNSGNIGDGEIDNHIYRLYSVISVMNYRV